MKYRDLPQLPVLQKVKAINFKDGQKNLRVFKWCMKVQPLINFIENERIKLIKKYINKEGTQVAKDKINDFVTDFQKILNMDIEEDAVSPVEIEWFDDCDYPEENMLLTPQEIEKVINLK